MPKCYKELESFEKDQVCSLCRSNQIDKPMLGPIYKTKTLIVHYYCMLLATKVEQNGADDQGILGFFVKDIYKEIKRGADIVCCYCRGKGATIHCSVEACKCVFHLPCGHQNGTLSQFCGQFNSFCFKHSPKQAIPPAIKKQILKNRSCPVCYCDVTVDKSYTYLWPTCCKHPSVFHRYCIQRAAINSGYYFRCPLCNNKDEFPSQMQQMGIYIPEMEAVWERQPGAFRELLDRNIRCQAQPCLCKKGPTYVKKRSPWQIELCSLCGSEGRHLECTGVWKAEDGFDFEHKCEICSEAIEAPNVEPVRKEKTHKAKAPPSVPSESEQSTEQSSESFGMPSGPEQISEPKISSSSGSISKKKRIRTRASGVLPKHTQPSEPELLSESTSASDEIVVQRRSSRRSVALVTPLSKPKKKSPKMLKPHNSSPIISISSDEEDIVKGTTSEISVAPVQPTSDAISLYDSDEENGKTEGNREIRIPSPFLDDCYITNGDGNFIKLNPSSSAQTPTSRRQISHPSIIKSNKEEYSNIKHISSKKQQNNLGGTMGMSSSRGISNQNSWRESPVHNNSPFDKPSTSSHVATFPAIANVLSLSQTHENESDSDSDDVTYIETLPSTKCDSTNRISLTSQFCDSNSAKEGNDMLSKLTEISIVRRSPTSQLSPSVADLVPNVTLSTASSSLPIASLRKLYSRSELSVTIAKPNCIEVSDDDDDVIVVDDCAPTLIPNTIKSDVGSSTEEYINVDISDDEIPNSVCAINVDSTNDPNPPLNSSKLSIVEKNEPVRLKKNLVGRPRKTSHPPLSPRAEEKLLLKSSPSSMKHNDTPQFKRRSARFKNATKTNHDVSPPAHVTRSAAMKIKSTDANDQDLNPIDFENVIHSKPKSGSSKTSKHSLACEEAAGDKKRVKLSKSAFKDSSDQKNDQSIVQEETGSPVHSTLDQNKPVLVKKRKVIKSKKGPDLNPTTPNSLIIPQNKQEPNPNHPNVSNELCNDSNAQVNALSFSDKQSVLDSNDSTLFPDSLDDKLSQPTLHCEDPRIEPIIPDGVSISASGSTEMLLPKVSEEIEVSSPACDELIINGGVSLNNVPITCDIEPVFTEPKICDKSYGDVAIVDHDEDKQLHCHEVDVTISNNSKNENAGCSGNPIDKSPKTDIVLENLDLSNCDIACKNDLEDMKTTCKRPCLETNNNSTESDVCEAAHDSKVQTNESGLVFSNEKPVNCSESNVDTFIAQPNDCLQDDSSKIIVSSPNIEIPLVNPEPIMEYEPEVSDESLHLLDTQIQEPKDQAVQKIEQPLVDCEPENNLAEESHSYEESSKPLVENRMKELNNITELDDESEQPLMDCEPDKDMIEEHATPEVSFKMSSDSGMKELNESKPPVMDYEPKKDIVEENSSSEGSLLTSVEIGMEDSEDKLILNRGQPLLGHDPQESPINEQSSFEGFPGISPNDENASNREKLPGCEPLKEENNTMNVSVSLVQISTDKKSKLEDDVTDSNIDSKLVKETNEETNNSGTSIQMTVDIGAVDSKEKTTLIVTETNNVDGARKQAKEVNASGTPGRRPSDRFKPYEYNHSYRKNDQFNYLDVRRSGGGHHPRQVFPWRASIQHPPSFRGMSPQPYFPWGPRSTTGHPHQQHGPSNIMPYGGRNSSGSYQSELYDHALKVVSNLLTKEVETMDESHLDPPSPFVKFQENCSIQSELKARVKKYQGSECFIVYSDKKLMPVGHLLKMCFSSYKSCLIVVENGSLERILKEIYIYGHCLKRYRLCSVFVVAESDVAGTNSECEISDLLLNLSLGKQNIKVIPCTIPSADASTQLRWGIFNLKLINLSKEYKFNCLDIAKILNSHL